MGVESLQDISEMAKDEFKFPPWLEKILIIYTSEMAKTALKMYTMHGSQPISERKYHEYHENIRAKFQKYHILYTKNIDNAYSVNLLYVEFLLIGSMIGSSIFWYFDNSSF